MTRHFTGRHMLVLMLAFFGSVIAVNLVMATLATRTFGGTVVDNSYVASQRFNGWLDDARAQDRLGWTATVEMGPDRHVTTALAARSGQLDGAVVTALASHPVGREADVQLRFRSVGGGRHRSDAPLPPGRWNLHVEVQRGADRLRLLESVQ